MESVVSLWLLLAVVGQPPPPPRDASKLKFDTYSGYFVSNRFNSGQPAAESFLAPQDAVVNSTRSLAWPWS